MPKKRRYLDDNTPQDTIKKDPAYKSLSERIMYRFWDGSPRDTYKAIDESKYLQSEPFVIDEFLGGTPQRTYFMNRNKQRQSMLYNGYQEGTPGDYGLVQKAVGKRNLPVYQTAPDEANRDNLVPIANIDNVWYGDARSSLRHPGSFPSTLYVDGRTGNTFYQKAWDLNDYGPKNGGETIRNSNWFAKARAAFADAVGSPIVQTTGYQQVSDRDIDKAYANYLADHGLHIEDGLVSLPVVNVRDRRELKNGGKIPTNKKSISKGYRSQYPYARGEFTGVLPPSVTYVPVNKFAKNQDEYFHHYEKGQSDAAYIKRNPLLKRVRENDSPTKTVSGLLEDETNVMISNNEINPITKHRLSAKHNERTSIPYLEDKEVIIDGNRVSTNLLDTIYKYANIANIPFKTALGLAVQESRLGAIPAGNYGQNSELRTDRDLGNMNYFRAYGSVPMYALVRDWDWLNNTDHSEHPLIHAFNKFESGTYNRGDKNHTKDVLNAGLSAFSSPAVQEWGHANGYFKNGGRIYIKPENRGKFTALKERTGHSASWFKENGTPAQKKMAVFALNSRKWKH